MNLFSMDQFQGGLISNVDNSKLSGGAYPLLINGRTRQGGVQGVKKHLKLATPTGKKQGLYVVGNLLILFVAGSVYVLDTTKDNVWVELKGWIPLDGTVDRIYAEMVPISYFQGGITYEGTDISNTQVIFQGIAAPTQAGLYVTDGVNQGRFILPDGSYHEVQPYASWTTTNPEYVPVGVLPRKSGSKLYLIDNVKRNKIYNSVTGRFLDFVINRNPDGDKGGDAETTFKAVDYNSITATAPLVEGGLFIGTLYSSYAINPDYSSTIFGEPSLRESELFPTGPVNERSFADIQGDMAFITQAGIQSFNITAQYQKESNNFQLSAPIANLLTQPQSETAAVNYDTYALFSVDTIYGKAVLVFDTTRQAFISIDFGFQTVVDFCVVKTSGARSLYFLDSLGDVYEAYGSSEYAVRKIYLGDFTSQQAGTHHKVGSIRLQFGNVKEPVIIQVSYYGDNSLIYKTERTITPNENSVDLPDEILPFSPINKAESVDVGVINPKHVWRSGVYLEWQGAADLLSMSIEGDPISKDNYSRITTTTGSSLVLTAFSGTRIETEYTTGTHTITEGWYSVVGTCNRGGDVRANTAFYTKAGSVIVTGSLRNCDEVYNILDKMHAAGTSLVIGCGGHAYPSGTSLDCEHIRNLMAGKNYNWISGAVDCLTGNGVNFYKIKPSQAYYVETIGDVSLFFLDQTAPNTQYSAQAQWLKIELESNASKFKIIVIGEPPFTGATGKSGGTANLRWPFAKWGAHLVLSGGGYGYERYLQDSIPYINVGPAAGSVLSYDGSALTTENTTGYVKLTIDKYNIIGEYKDYDNVTLDMFGVYAN